MNEKPNENQIPQDRWEEMRLQHLALAIMIGDLRHEVRTLRAIVLGLATAEGKTVNFEDHISPETVRDDSVETFVALMRQMQLQLKDGENPRPKG